MCRIMGNNLGSMKKLCDLFALEMLIVFTQQTEKLVFVEITLSLRDQCAHWSRNDRKLGAKR